MYGGYVTNASMECVWKDKNEMCPPIAPLGTMLGRLIHLIEEKGKEHQAFLIKAGRPNRLISVPKVSDEVWDMVMSRHPKTLALCSLIIKSSELCRVFLEITQEIYSLGESLTPLHLKIEMWHAAMVRQHEHCVLEDDAELAALQKSSVLVPRQSYLFELDPTDSKTIQDMRILVMEEALEYTRLLSEKNKDHKGMTLDDILDLAEKSHFLEDKGEGWSVVDWGCSCPGCYKHVHCCHMVLFGMMLNASLKVPEGLEIAEPSLRKGRAMSSGTAGQIRQKRKRLLAAIAADSLSGEEIGG